MATPATTYKVKKGDTLGAIAKNLGVGIDAISGFKSGNKDLIYPDETLTITTAPKTTGSSITQDKASKMSTKDLSIALAGGDYAGAVKDELGEDAPSGSDKYKTDYDTYKQSRESAYEKLKGITTDTFDSEYKKRDLDKSKERIAELDDEIASARQLRDDAIFKVKSNPGLSAAQMTGDIAKLSEAQNATINNLIGQRNSVATEYNSSLDEIDGIVERASKDAQLEFSYWDGLTQEAQGMLTEYEKALKEELKAGQEQDNFETQLAQQLQIAMMKDNTSGGGGSDDNWKLIYDDFGEPLYWYNSKTKEIDYNVGKGDAGNGGGSTGTGTNFDDIEEEAAAEEDDGVGFWQGIKNWFTG